MHHLRWPMWIGPRAVDHQCNRRIASWLIDIETLKQSDDIRATDVVTQIPTRYCDTLLAACECRMGTLNHKTHTSITSHDDWTGHGLDPTIRHQHKRIAATYMIRDGSRTHCCEVAVLEHVSTVTVWSLCTVTHLLPGSADLICPLGVNVHISFGK